MANYQNYTVGTFHSSCYFVNLLMPRGGGPENVVIYGVLSPSSQIWLVHGKEVKTDWELKLPHCTCPISSRSKKLDTTPSLASVPGFQRQGTWILRLYPTFGYQKHPVKEVTFWNQLFVWNALHFSFNLHKKWASNFLNWQRYEVFKYGFKHQST